MKFVVSLVALLLVCAHAEAEAKMLVTGVGSGFNDSRAVEPVGGNPATTIGQQRLLAIQFAADIWGRLLDSNVQTEIRVRFAPMGCGDDTTVLASAGASDLHEADGPDAEPGIVYHAALANRLAGRDLWPDEPEIVMSFNTDIDDMCSDALGGFYYGFDGKPGDKIDVVEIALHELAHGLGFQAWIDPSSGESSFADGLDAFSAHVHDLDTGRDWSAMSPRERVVSLENARRVVWNGESARQLSPNFLDAGTPSLGFAPRVQGFIGNVSETGFATNPAFAPVSGPVVSVGVSTGCSNMSAASKRVALVNLDKAPCKASELAKKADEAGVLGLLLVVPFVTDDPALPLPVSITGIQAKVPTLTLSELDGQAVAAALTRGTLTASLAGSASQLLGADETGRPLLYTPTPYSPGSSLSHFDTSARPDLLMEPFTTGGSLHRADLTAAVFHDMGWKSLCGNGALDYGEECDAAAGNGDGAGAACRSSCLLPGCGDGLPDPAEACDSGRDNNDTLPGACRTDCQAARCGDGVIDDGERCDRGPENGVRGCGRDCQPLGEPPATASVVVDSGTPTTCAPNCTPALDASVPEREPELRPWGEASIPPRKRDDSGCRLAGDGGPRAVPSLALLLWVLRRRRRSQA